MRQIKGMIVSYKADPKFIKILEKLNIEVIFTKKHKNLPEPVDDHPDLVILPLEEKILLVEKNHYEYYKEKLEKYDIKIIPTKKSIGSIYPEDVLLNVACFKEYYIGKTDIIDLKAREYFKKKKRKPLLVNQGYANCSSLIASEDLLITQDKSIYKALIKEGLHSYLLPQGGIVLPGYSTGFIGGTYGMINDTVMVFYGDLDRFIHKEELKFLLEKESIDLIYPKGIEFVDRGSMIGIY